MGGLCSDKNREDENDDNDDDDENKQEDPKKVKSRYGMETKNWSTHRQTIERYNKFVNMVTKNHEGSDQQDIQKKIVDNFFVQQGEKPAQQGLKRRFYKDGEDDKGSSTELENKEAPVKPIDSFLYL